MRVRMVDGGSQAFNALIYKPPDENMLNYLNNNIQRAVEVAGNVSERFINTTKQLYDKFNSSAVINASKALVYGVGDHTNHEVIYPLSVDRMVNANFAMQQWIMAHPVISQMNHDNMCHGFQETYYNREQGVTGVDRDDYQVAMNGMLQFDSDGNGYSVQYTNTHDNELSTMDQFAIRDTWDNISLMLAEDLDPTDPDGGEL